MRPIGRNESTTTFVLNKSLKLSSCNAGEDPKEQVRDHFVTNEKKSKYRQKIMAALRDLSNMEDFLRRSSYCSESGREITFYLNIAKNGLYFWMKF